MKLDRRNFLKASAAQAALVGVGAGVGVSGCATHPGADGVASDLNPFEYGVASGDPLADRVILWTRVSPPSDRMDEPIEVDWWIAREATGRDPVDGGRVQAEPSRDFTVKVDAAGLDPDRDYYFGFTTNRGSSPIGRTRTLPVGPTRSFRFAFTSCANYPEGYFNAYAAIAARDDIAVVLHLGDYLYEYGNGEYGDGTELGRLPDPVHETVSLEDYRRRHATYKRDPDLMAAHARHPWITVWDDHELANNAWKGGAENHHPEAGEGAWSERSLAAIRAYSEWMPVRDLPTGLFRRFAIGDLAELVMLDTRFVGRDRQPDGDDHVAASDPARSLLGEHQERFLLDALTEAQARDVRWKVIGQQVIFTPLTDGVERFNPDSWDGYRASRRRLLDHIAGGGIGDVVFLTGDVHSAWAFEVPPSLGSDEVYDPATGDGAGALELVTSAVSSPPLGRSPEVREIVEDLVDRYPYIRYSDLESQGFVVVDLDPERIEVRFMRTGRADERSGEAHCGAAFVSASGANRLERVDTDVCRS